RAGNRCCIAGEASFVRRKFRHDVIEMIGGAGSVLLLEAGSTQDPQERLDVPEAAWPCWRRAGKHARRVTMGEQSPAHVPGALGQLIAPAARGAWQRTLGADFIPEQRQQLLLASDVSIQGGCLDVEPLGEPAHRQLVESDLVEERERRANDLRLIEGLALLARLTLAKRDHAHRGGSRTALSLAQRP